jgi:hypothetical protein
MSPGLEEEEQVQPMIQAKDGRTGKGNGRRAIRIQVYD